MAENVKRAPETKEIQATSGERSALRPFAPWGSWGGLGPFSFMRRIADEMDRMFDEAFRGFGTLEVGEPLRGGFWPAVDVTRTDGEVVIHADLPGVRSEDVTVEVEENALILRGERRHEAEHTNGGIRRTERSYGSFYRAIPLPEGADPEKAKAEFHDGVLEIRVPAPQTVRRIPIHTEKEGAKASA